MLKDRSIRLSSYLFYCTTNFASLESFVRLLLSDNRSFARNQVHGINKLGTIQLFFLKRFFAVRLEIYVLLAVKSQAQVNDSSFNDYMDHYFTNVNVLYGSLFYKFQCTIWINILQIAQIFEEIICHIWELSVIFFTDIIHKIK